MRYELNFIFQQKLREKLVYDDLDWKCDPVINNGPTLQLTHIDRYLHGPVSNPEDDDSVTDNLKDTMSELLREMDKWALNAYLPRQPSTSLVSPAAAVSALGELTPGGALMKGFREDSLGRKFRSVSLNQKV